MPKEKLSKGVILAAPEGATHYGKSFLFPYHKLEEGEVYYYKGFRQMTWVKYENQEWGKKFLAKCVKLPTKDDWIRHRGGVPKCVDKITEVRLRDGRIRTSLEWLGGNVSHPLLWGHFGAKCYTGKTDIMAYKVGG